MPHTASNISHSSFSFYVNDCFGWGFLFIYFFFLHYDHINRSNNKVVHKKINTEKCRWKIMDKNTVKKNHMLGKRQMQNTSKQAVENK